MFYTKMRGPIRRDLGAAAFRRRSVYVRGAPALLPALFRACGLSRIARCLILLAMAATALSFGVSAQTAQAGQSSQKADGNSSVVVVKMTNKLRFVPGTVTIRAGQTIKWTNPSSVGHTVTADPSKAARQKDVHLPKGAEPFNSGIIKPGQTYEHAFTVPGHYKYFCIPHEFAGMIANVIVKPSKKNASAAAAGQKSPPGQTGTGKAKSSQAGGLPFVLGAHRPPRPSHYREATGVAKFLYWLGDFHPASTDITVGAILLDFLSEILLLITRKQSFAVSTRYCIWIGGIGAIVTAALGWCFAGVVFYDQVSILTIHRIFGSFVGLWGPATLAISEISRAKNSSGWTWTFRGALFFLALVVGTTGYLGGSMIYGLDHYVWLSGPAG